MRLLLLIFPMLSLLLGEQAHAVFQPRLTSADGVLAAAFTPNLLNQLDAIGGQAQAFDANGNQTRLQDNAGLSTLHGPNSAGGPAGRDLHLTWSDADYLVRAYDAATGHSSEWAYDGMGRRIEERRYAGTALSPPAVNASAVSVTRTIYSGRLPIATLTVDAPAALASATPATVPAVHRTSGLASTWFRVAEAIAWGADLSGHYGALQGTGGLLATTTYAAPVGAAPPVATTLYYNSDALGHVTTVTDSSDTVRARYAYSAYGQVLSAEGDLASTNRWRYTSKATDLWTTGFAEFGYRWYDPATGRWLSRDPLGEAGGFNLYEHNFGNPGTFFDPDGELGQIALGAIVGGIIGGGIEGWNGGDLWDIIQGAASGAVSGALYAAVGIVGSAAGMGAWGIAGAHFMTQAGAELLNQLLKVARGKQCGINWKQVGAAGLFGAVVGPAHSLVGKGLGAALRGAGKLAGKALSGLKSLAGDFLEAGKIPWHLRGGRLNPLNYDWGQLPKNVGSGLPDLPDYVKPGQATKTTASGGESALQGAQLNRHLSQLEQYGAAGSRTLESGRVRYYGNVTPARTPGEMAGRQLVGEWDPSSNATRTWHETVDHAGSVRIVRPESGGPKVHYQFDASGNFTGSW